MSRIHSRPILVLAATVALLAGGSAVTSATNPTSDVADALLVESDVPPGFTGKGIKDATDFDIDQASFDANGGLDKADQVWTADTVTGVEPLVYVFDFRMLFPDAAAAQAYLDAAEPIISEQVSGITLQPDPPPIGDDTRLYAGSLSSGDVKVDAQNVLFRVGPVVAKEYIGGFGTTIEDALPVVQAAEARISGWLAAAPTPSIAASDGQVHQWAASAFASSQYLPGDWSANQATGAPDVPDYADDKHAWAPYRADGVADWLQVTFREAVVPTAVNIVETYGNGDVARIEAFDPASGAWVELWSGTDPTPNAVAAFSPSLRPVTFPVDLLRITLGDTVPGWSEIDAVELVGAIP